MFGRFPETGFKKKSRLRTSDDASESITEIFKAVQKVRRKGGNEAAAAVLVERCGDYGVKLVQDKKSGGWEARPCSSTG